MLEQFSTNGKSRMLFNDFVDYELKNSTLRLSLRRFLLIDLSWIYAFQGDRDKALKHLAEYATMIQHTA